ncbi:hypothetical protein DIPPA_20959 [Diplonema papillatum]|nr:hypothetical protein DIPPA_20959 [Diplonema papillatum]
MNQVASPRHTFSFRPNLGPIAPLGPAVECGMWLPTGATNTSPLSFPASQFNARVLAAGDGAAGDATDCGAAGAAAAKHRKKARTLPTKGGKPTFRARNPAAGGGGDVPGWTAAGGKPAGLKSELLAADVAAFGAFVRLRGDEVEERAAAHRVMAGVLSDIFTEQTARCGDVPLLPPVARVRKITVTDELLALALPASPVVLTVAGVDFDDPKILAEVAARLQPHCESPRVATDASGAACVKLTFRRLDVEICGGRSLLAPQGAAAAIAAAAERFPEVTCACLLIQTILSQCHRLGPGGLHPWTVFVMLAASRERFTGEVPPSSARVFMDFLASYGWVFDVEKNAVRWGLEAGDPWPLKQAGLDANSLDIVCPLTGRQLASGLAKPQPLLATFQYCYMSISKWENMPTYQRYHSPVANVVAHRKIRGRAPVQAGAECPK